MQLFTTFSTSYLWLYSVRKLTFARYALMQPKEWAFVPQITDDSCVDMFSMIYTLRVGWPKFLSSAWIVEVISGCCWCHIQLICYRWQSLSSSPWGRACLFWDSYCNFFFPWDSFLCVHGRYCESCQVRILSFKMSQVSMCLWL